MDALSKLTLAEYPPPTRLKSFEELCFENIYTRLPSIFHSKHSPEALQNQFPIHFNNEAAKLIELDPDQASRTDFLDLLTGRKKWQGIDPLAMCYAGHQFGQYVPRLGDGRALLLGQVKTSTAQRWDLQLKGSGLTRYSRQGDGKAVLRSTIREYLGSAAMNGLGIPTTHALTLFGSEEQVYREQIETGAMLLRMAPSHIRFGTFEYFFYQNQYDHLAKLASFTLENYYPHLRNEKEPVLAMFKEVVSSTAKLISNWQAVGFCHGVMNSDNMSIHGITLDYGPFGFLDRYYGGHICNHSDHGGRYAFNRQPRIGLFNLSCLAQALLPLFDDDPDEAVAKATNELEQYEVLFDRAYLDLKCAKLGFEKPIHSNNEIYDQLLELMEANQSDFTNTFRLLSEQKGKRDSLRDQFININAYDEWFGRYLKRLESEGKNDHSRSNDMKKVNPKYVLRNYMAENAIRVARDDHDFGEIDRLMKILRFPFDEQPENTNYADNPPDWSEGLSVSCSS